MRAVRSTSRSTASRHTQGPPISSSAPATAPGASRFDDVPPLQRSDRAHRREPEPAVRERRLGVEAPALAPARARARRRSSATPTTARSRARARRAARSPRRSASTAATQRVSRPTRPRARGTGGSRLRPPAPGARRRAGRASDRPRGSARCPRRPPRSRARRSSWRRSGAPCGVIVRRARRGRTPTPTCAIEVEHPRAGRRPGRRPRSSRRPPCRACSTCPARASPCTRRATSGGTTITRGRRRRRAPRRASRRAGSCTSLRSTSSVPIPSRYSSCSARGLVTT